MRFGILIIILSLLSCEQNSNLTNWLKEAPFFTSQNLFSNERFPNLVISNNGTLIATWGSSKVVAKRSTNGGKSWSNEIIISDPGFHGGGTLVDEVTGNIFVFVEELENFNYLKKKYKNIVFIDTFRSKNPKKIDETYEKIFHTIFFCKLVKIYGHVITPLFF